MAKKIKKTRIGKGSSNRVQPSDLSTALPPGAQPVDHLAFRIMLNYVNGTDSTDIRRIVDSSYKMADSFLEKFNERRDNSQDA